MLDSFVDREFHGFSIGVDVRSECCGRLYSILQFGCQDCGVAYGILIREANGESDGTPIHLPLESLNCCGPFQDQDEVVRAILSFVTDCKSFEPFKYVLLPWRPDKSPELDSILQVFREVAE